MSTANNTTPGSLSSLRTVLGKGVKARRKSVSQHPGPVRFAHPDSWPRSPTMSFRPSKPSWRAGVLILVSRGRTVPVPDIASNEIVISE